MSKLQVSKQYPAVSWRCPGSGPAGPPSRPVLLSLAPPVRQFLLAAEAGQQLFRQVLRPSNTEGDVSAVSCFFLLKIFEGSGHKGASVLTSPNEMFAAASVIKQAK